MTDAAVPPRVRRNNAQRWSRLLHSWASMVSMLLVLFFAVTGLTLNHQDWTFGQEPTVTTVTGTLPGTWPVTGEVDFLAASEYLRSELGARGEVTDHGLDGSEGRIAYQGPGSADTVTFDTRAGSFTLTSTRHGLVAVANDLHMGRHSSDVWRLAIDLAAVVLALVALTGLLLGVLIPRRRRTALALLAIGSVAGVAALLLA